MKRDIMAVNICIKKEEISQINNLIVYLKGLEEDQTKSKANMKKEIGKMRVEIRQ